MFLHPPEIDPCVLHSREAGAHQEIGKHTVCFAWSWRQNVENRI